MADFMPKTDADFDEWLENFKTKISAIATPLGVPAGLITAVGTAYTDWDVAFDAQTVAQDMAQAATQTKDEAKVAGMLAVRAVVGIMQKNPALGDAERAELGITIPDRIPTPISPEYMANLAAPLLLLDWAQKSKVTVHFGVNPSNEKLNKKPTDIAGAKIWYRIDTGPWTFVADDTNSPYTHFFSITDPQNVEYRCQWFDKKMRTGPFGESARCTVTP